MPVTRPFGHCFSQTATFAPPPQPASKTRASAFACICEKPQSASFAWPLFIILTISRPPRPLGLQVF